MRKYRTECVAAWCYSDICSLMWWTPQSSRSSTDVLYVSEVRTVIGRFNCVWILHASSFILSDFKIFEQSDFFHILCVGCKFKKNVYSFPTYLKCSFRKDMAVSKGLRVRYPRTVVKPVVSDILHDLVSYFRLTVNTQSAKIHGQKSWEWLNGPEIEYG